MPKVNSHLPLLLNLSELILPITKGRGIKEAKMWGREARVLFLRMLSSKRGLNKPGHPKTWQIKELKPKLGFLLGHLP